MRERGQRNMAPLSQDLLRRIMTERELEHTLSAPSQSPDIESHPEEPEGYLPLLQELNVLLAQY